MPYLLGIDFLSFFVFLFRVNMVEWNMGFKRVYFGLNFISKGISFILFGNYIHYDFQSRVGACSTDMLIDFNSTTTPVLFSSWYLSGCRLCWVFFFAEWIKMQMECKMDEECDLIKVKILHRSLCVK